MQIKTADLDAGEIHLEFGADPSQIPNLADVQTKGEMRFEAPLKVSLSALRSGDMIAVQGRFAIRVALACARCLVSHLQSLESAFELCYLLAEERGGGADRAADAASMEKERELDAREAGLIRFKGDTIDLAEGIGEQVIMELPFKPLCRPDCMGLCSRCGANLNQMTCDCDATAGDNPFAVLKGWRGESAEE
jgi:uncharacterized protein